jgi:hypothetical protein
MLYLPSFARRPRRIAPVKQVQPVSRAILIEPLEGRLFMSASVHSTGEIAPSCCPPPCCAPKCCPPKICGVCAAPIPCNPCCKETVTISGSNFTPGSKVLLCSPCGQVFCETCDIVCESCNKITLSTNDLAKGGPGVWSAVVINCNGQSSCPYNFCVTACCESEPGQPQSD